jgi:hypothetical protein
VDNRELGNKQVKNSGLFVVPKVPQPPPAKVVTYTASGQVVIQSEFSDQLEELTKNYIEEYKPDGITELTLVRDLAVGVCRCEYTQRMLDQLGDRVDEKTQKALKRYQSSNRGMFKRSLKLLKEIQKTRAAEAARKPQLVKPRTIGGR